ncbi:MAG: response regulator [Smithellaceae bacterium]|nr:response regulator [Syntrophaceae bacterium]MDD4240328.1 response regulator [Smithellaceae bacterium]NLX51854.1 response regulator [Deltaproteobacteria bacterium]
MTDGLNGPTVCNARQSSSDEGKSDGQKIRRVCEVLIVDDEEPLLLTITEGLSIYRKYFHLHTATNGADAVRILKSLSPVDLVLTDLSMPKMDGFELLAYMNRNYPRIPVILMTAYGTPKIEEILGSMGTFRYLEKPLDINTIADTIFEALAIPSDQAASRPSGIIDGEERETGLAALCDRPEYYKKTMP